MCAKLVSFFFSENSVSSQFPRLARRKNASSGKISIKRAAQDVEKPPAKLGAGHIKTSKWNIKALKVSVVWFLVPVAGRTKKYMKVSEI